MNRRSFFQVLASLVCLPGVPAAKPWGFTRHRFTLKYYRVAGSCKPEPAWGYSRVTQAYREIWYGQVMRRNTPQALALDHIGPPKLVEEA